MTRQIPLRLALLVPTILVLSGTAGLICLINGHNAEQSAAHLAVELQRRTTREVEAFLSSELRGPQQAIQAMADAVQSGMVDPHDERRTALYLSRLAGVFPNAPFLNYGLADGTFIGVGQGGNRRDPQLVLVVTRPESVLRTAQYKLLADGGRGKLDYSTGISDFRLAPWYAQPLQAGRPIWTQIYNWDDQPEVMALGAGMPIRREGRVIGVAGVDMILANISAFLHGVAGRRGVVLYITDQDGLLVASSTGQRPFDLVNGTARRRPPSRDPDPWIRASAAAAPARLDGQRPRQLSFREGQRRGLLRLTPWRGGRGLRWQIAMVMPEASYAGIVGQQIRNTLGITALALLGAAGMGWAAVRLVCRPLERVTAAVEGLAAGGQPQPIPSSPIAEIGRLSRSLDDMAARMGASLQGLQERHLAVEQQIQLRSAQLRAANAKLHEELDRAAAVQAGMLIDTGQLARLSPSVEASVRLVPSKEVAGDLYDAIPLGSHRLCFCIGDVAGKGMPAALLMSTCLSLLRTYVELLDSPAQIMGRINRHLSATNEDCAFTTLLVITYHTRTGELHYCNAGHNPALVRRSDGRVERLDQVHGPALGIEAEIRYRESILQLAEGDTVLAYTDGANETFNPARQRFGMKRLQGYLQAAEDLPPEQLLDGLLAQLDQFAAGEEHHDDTTLLAFRRMPWQADSRDRDGGLRLRVRNQLSGVAEALTEVRAYAEQQGISISRIRRLMAVIDELLNNTIAYGCKELGNRAEIGLELIQSGDRLVLTLHDNGEPFNPIALQSPDIASESQERRIGGLGIHLVRGLTSASRYKYENGRNRLTLEMR
jgi:serine phosphatase RsbU (regulator of sigma subunit)/anti-sigma regulatory factor (Ser/Thr protein kinase)